MSDKSRRHRSSLKAAIEKRPDQGSDPKRKYKIRRKFGETVDPIPNDKQKPASLKEQLGIEAVQAVAPEEAQPFLKWVGGKSQLLEQFDKFFPQKIERYFEPFVGGGAVFFHLRHRFPAMRAFLRDVNDELINAYVAVRSHRGELMKKLDEHLENFLKDRDAYYYLVRSKHHLPKNHVVERAARMIFLNKTCFNGLWRVNARGEFNVPIGSQKKPSLYDESNIIAASAALERAHLEIQDFRDTIAQANAGDFVYIDPPYYPVSATASFTAYAKDDFGAEEQHELAALFRDAAKRGVRLMLSNSDTDFIRNLYRDFDIQTVRARRAINCDGSKRGEVNEIIVCAGG